MKLVSVFDMYNPIIYILFGLSGKSKFSTVPIEVGGSACYTDSLWFQQTQRTMHSLLLFLKALNRLGNARQCISGQRHSTESITA